MKPGLVLLLLAATAAPAAADDDERSMFVSFGGTVGIGAPASGETAFGEEADAEGVLMARVSLSWDLAPLPYKEPKGYNWRGGMAPEVALGRLRVADHRTGDSDDNAANFVAIGGRLEASFSQQKMGLLEVSARGGFYVGGKVGLLDDEHNTPLLELLVGEYLYAGDTVRFGAELGFLGLWSKQDQVDFAREGVSARGPWLDYSGDYYAFVSTLYLGVKI